MGVSCLVQPIHDLNTFERSSFWRPYGSCDACFGVYITSDQCKDKETPQGTWMLFNLFYMFSNFYWLDLQNKPCVALANLQWIIHKNLRWKIKSPLIYLWLLKVNICWLLSQIQWSSQLCSLLSLEYLMIFKDALESLLNMCLYGVCSLILTEPHTNQMQVSNLRRGTKEDPPILNEQMTMRQSISSSLSTQRHVEGMDIPCCLPNFPQELCNERDLRYNLAKYTKSVRI